MSRSYFPHCPEARHRHREGPPSERHDFRSQVEQDPEDEGLARRLGDGPEPAEVIGLNLFEDQAGRSLARNTTSRNNRHLFKVV